MTSPKNPIPADVLVKIEKALNSALYYVDKEQDSAKRMGWKPFGKVAEDENLFRECLALLASVKEKKK